MNNIDKIQSLDNIYETVLNENAPEWEQYIYSPEDQHDLTLFYFWLRGKATPYVDMIHHAFITPSNYRDEDVLFLAAAVRYTVLVIGVFTAPTTFGTVAVIAGTLPFIQLFKPLLEALDLKPYFDTAEGKVAILAGKLLMEIGFLLQFGHLYRISDTCLTSSDFLLRRAGVLLELSAYLFSATGLIGLGIALDQMEDHQFRRQKTQTIDPDQINTQKVMLQSLFPDLTFDPFVIKNGCLDPEQTIMKWNQLKEPLMVDSL